MGVVLRHIQIINPTLNGGIWFLTSIFQGVPSLNPKGWWIDIPFSTIRHPFLEGPGRQFLHLFHINWHLLQSRLSIDMPLRCLDLTKKLSHLQGTGGVFIPHNVSVTYRIRVWFVYIPTMWAATIVVNGVVALINGLINRVIWLTTCYNLYKWILTLLTTGRGPPCTFTIEIN